MADAGGFNLGGGYVEIDVDLSPARAKMEAFKGEIQNYFSGAVVAPVGASGVAPSAASGGVASPAGGGGMASGFSGLPGVASPLQIGASAFPNIIPGGGTAGGSDILSAREGTAAIREAAQELAGALREAAASVGGGGGGVSLPPRGLASHPSYLPVGQNFGMGQNIYDLSGEQFTEPLSELIPSSVSTAPSDLRGAARRQERRGFRSRYDTAANPGQMFSAPPAPMGLAPSGTGIDHGEGGFAELDLLASGGALDPGFVQDIEGADALGTMNREQRGRLDTFAQRMRATGQVQRGTGRAGVGGFGVYGAVSRATGIPYAGVVGGAIALHYANSFARTWDENDPSMAMNQLTQVGSSVNLSSNPIAVNAAIAGAQLRQNQGAFDMMPFGHLVDDFLSTGHFSMGYAARQMAIQGNERMVSGLAYGANAMFGINQRAAAIMGDPIGEVQARQAAELAPLISTAIATHGLTNPALMGMAGMHRQELQQAIFVQATQRAGVGQRIGALQLEGAGLADVSAAVGSALAGNSVQEAQFNREATARRNEAAIGFFQDETTQKLAGIVNPIDKENERRSREQLLSNLQTQSRIDLQVADANIVRAQREASSVPSVVDAIDVAANSPGNPYRTQQFQLNADWQRLGSDDPRRFIVSAQMRTLRTQTHRSVRSAFLRAEGNEYEADLNDVGDEDSPARTVIQANQRFRMSVFNESIEARVGAASDEVSLMPMAAQARRDVARARQEVASASVQERPGVIRAVQAELQSTAQLLTAQRGGQTAIDVRGNEAIGMLAATGVDLSGHMRDVQEAQRRYGAGAGDAANAPQRTPLSGEELKKALSKIDAWLDKFEPADVSFLRRK
jgi:hypothetical protein